MLDRSKPPSQTDHVFTEGEAVVLRSLLAALPTTEKERMRQSGLSPRTFEDIRQRAYAKGWVYDRYLPDPVRCGTPALTAILAQPFAEKLTEVAEAWAAHPSNVVLWRWPETLFGIFFNAEGKGRTIPYVDSPPNFRNEFHVAVDVRQGGLPVYFDFEASWSRFSELPGTLAYPRGLGGAFDEQAASRFSDRERERIQELVERPFRDGASSGPLRVSPFFLSRAQQGLLEDKVAERRVLLDLTRAQAFRDRRIRQVAFLHGELLPRSTPEQLFRRLMAIHVTPFLFVTEGTQVLLGALSAVPPLSAGRSERPAVLANLQQFLQGITITREPLESLRVLVDHRYDRLLRLG